MAKEIDIYKKEMNNQSTPVNGDMTPKETDSAHYNDLRKESYRTMLNSEIQASIAKDRALKYTQNALAAQGLGSQGVSESARVGIMNDYHNANQDAVSQYRKELLGINQDERKEDLANFDTNAEYLTELLDGTKKQDIYGNVIGADLDEYREIMKNYGFEFNENNEIDATNAKVNEAQKLAFIENYNKALRDYGNTNNAENNNVNTPTTFKYEADTSKTDLNRNFVVTINGVKQKYEMGGLIGGYGKSVNVTQAKEEAKSKNKGDMWVHDDNGGNLTILIKTNKGNVRAIENVDANESKPDVAISLFNAVANGKFVFQRTSTNNVVDTLTGTTYKLKQDSDGFFKLVKQNG